MASDIRTELVRREHRVPANRKPMYFRRKKYYKKRCLYLEDQLETKNHEISKLKECISDLYAKGKEEASLIFGPNSRIMVGDNNVITVTADDDWEEKITKLEGLIKVTSNNCRQTAEKLAETYVEIETLKTALQTVSRNIARVDQTTTSTESKVDFIHDLIKLAQDPNPTEDDVIGAVDAVQMMIAENRVPTTVKISHLPTKAQRLSQMLAMKYDTPYKEESLQRSLLGDTQTIRDRIENKCADWLVRWIRCHGTGPNAAKQLQEILHSLDVRLVQDRKDKIMKENIPENESNSTSSISDTGTLVEDMDVKEILNKLSSLNPVPRQLDELFQKMQSLEQIVKSKTFLGRQQEENYLTYPFTG